MGIIAILLTVASAAFQQPEPLIAASTGKSLDAFAACFVSAQEHAGRAWAFAAADRGGSFTNEGASGLAAAYHLQITSKGSGNNLRLYAEKASAAPVLKAIDQCR